MADLVRYLGELPANTLWGTSGTDDEHPIAVPMDQIHAWWWNPKRWKIDTDFHLVSTFSGGPISYAMDTGDLIAGAFNAARELDLTDGNIHHLHGPVSGATSGEVALRMLDPAGPNHIEQSGGSLYPHLLFHGSVPDPTNSGSFAFFDSKTSSSSGSTGTINITIKKIIDGVGYEAPSDIILPVYLGDSGDGFSTAVCSYITLTPVEFWPYDDGMGSPIHDTTSNLVIGDPTLGIPSSSSGSSPVHCRFTSGGVRYKAIIQGVFGSPA
jgi:hypothetical protein